MDNLKSQGVTGKDLDKVYSPIGINLGGETPEEIAFSIMAEILLIKNNGSFNHIKEIKR